jgi:uroporphyrinogen decarboxylase
MLTEVTVEYLVRQVGVGACAVQLFDTWAGELSAEEYRLLAKPFSEKIFSELQKKNIPSIHFTKQQGHLLEEMLSLSSDVLGMSSDVALADACKRTQGTQTTQRTKAIQGNLNPDILLKDKKTIRDETEKMLSKIPNPKEGYIVNLSHGIRPETPVENVKFFVEVCRGNEM